MDKCNKLGVVKTSKGFICREHLLSALSSDNKAELQDINYKCVDNVNDFISLVDGEKIEEKQIGLF